jgi:hypothetical protein
MLFAAMILYDPYIYMEDIDNIEYKIKKYTSKLKNARNNKVADYYRSKLIEYHYLNKINIFGYEKI